jgi:hypothetical protein
MCYTPSGKADHAYSCLRQDSSAVATTQRELFDYLVLRWKRQQAWVVPPYYGNQLCGRFERKALVFVL